MDWIELPVGAERNNATDYQSGDVFHADATLAEHPPLCKSGIIGGMDTRHTLEGDYVWFKISLSL
ncbi:MAG: hypothetical protein P4L55_11830 [Syntrophobacteraceae bacterium]|nr:hypothetical protein [Syntrophobacteraceae bacterium]